MAANENQEDATDADPKTQDRHKEQEPNTSTTKDEELNAATKGQGKGKKGSKCAKWYVERWHCGE